MVRSLLVRGMLAGLLGGLLAFGTARVLGEHWVDKAISFEDYVEYNLHHQPHEMEIVSRNLQSSAGLGTGAIIYGVAFGGIFALVFAAAYGRIGTLTGRGTAAVLGLLGFVSVYLVPSLKYPPNPPSIGNPDTIGRRTSLYLILVVVSVAMMVVAVVARRSLRHRVGEWNATLLVGAGYVAMMALAFVVMPGINEVPQAAIPTVVHAVTDAGVTFPPTVLWRFRIGSLAIQAALWGGLALAFGPLAERALRAPQAGRPARVDQPT